MDAVTAVLGQRSGLRLLLIEALAAAGTQAGNFAIELVAALGARHRGRCRGKRWFWLSPTRRREIVYKPRLYDACRARRRPLRSKPAFCGKNSPDALVACHVCRLRDLANANGPSDALPEPVGSEG